MIGNLNKLTQSFQSMTKSLDVIYVLDGKKPCSRIIVSEEKIPETRNILENLGLKISISDFKIKKESDYLRGYSDKGFILDKNSSEKGNFFVYISKSHEFAEKAKILEEKNDHISLGKILGYPDCCVKFFSDNFPEESKKKNDYVFPALKNSSVRKFPFENNIAIRHMDISLLSHFPCSFNCEKSAEIGKRNLNVIQKISPQVSEIFEKMLKCPVIYTEDEGIFILQNAKLSENKIGYGTFIASSQGRLHNHLANNHEILIRKNNGFSVGNISISGDSFAMMVFG